MGRVPCEDGPSVLVLDSELAGSMLGGLREVEIVKALYSNGFPKGRPHTHHLSWPEIGYSLLSGSYCTGEHRQSLSKDGMRAGETKRPAQTPWQCCHELTVRGLRSNGGIISFYGMR